LIEWYQAGGYLRIDELVDMETQEKIKTVIQRVGIKRLRPIKNSLPESIGYDEIRLVVAKMQKEGNIF
jgi:ATP-dependent DNA helicase RecQ